MDNKDLKSLSHKQLIEAVEQAGGKKFHADYILDFLHNKNTKSLNEITTISKSLRGKLEDDGYYISALELVETYFDDDGTTKYIFKTFDSCRIETVLLEDNNRLTICISSQIGCKMGCKFCATAKIGFKRNLSAGEIVDQVYKVSDLAGKISNVVFMGMGEPFDNYDNTITAAYLLNNPKGRNIGARHITISTCGIPEKISAFAAIGEQFRLAISLHSATDKLRSSLMPCNNKWNTADIIKALKEYYTITRRRITFEYCMIAGVNDSLADAETLYNFLKPVKCNVNLIEYNPHPKCNYKPSKKENINKFQKFLSDKGIETHTRFRRGVNIKAACGQLGLLGG